MMATFTILSVSVFGQDTIIISTELQKHPNRSKKELMKMEIMKIDTSPGNTNIPTIGSGNSDKYVTDITRSKKEQMKMELMGIDESTLYPISKIKSSKYAACAAHLNRSKKELMKMEVMKIHTCPDNKKL